MNLSPVSEDQVDSINLPSTLDTNLATTTGLGYGGRSDFTAIKVDPATIPSTLVTTLYYTIWWIQCRWGGFDEKDGGDLFFPGLKYLEAILVLSHWSRQRSSWDSKFLLHHSDLVILDDYLFHDFFSPQCMHEFPLSRVNLKSLWRNPAG